MALTTVQQNEIIKYVVGIFNAAPGGYMATFANFVSAGNSPQVMAQLLAGDPVFKGLSFAYSDASTDEQFVDAFLGNLLGASVSAGTLQIAKSVSLDLLASVSRAQYVVAAIDFVATVPADNADWGTARTQLETRTATAVTYTITNSGTSTNLDTLQSVVAGANVTTGQTFTLTTGIDTVAGTLGNDTINGLIDAATVANSTFTSLDNIDGGAGTDTLNLDGLTDLTPTAGTTVANVETATLRSGATTVADTSAWTGLTTLNSILATNTTLIAAATTNVNVSGATGDISVTGGLAQAITTAGGNVTSDDAAGAVTVNHTALAGGSILVDDGTNVTVTVAGSTGGGTIEVGTTDVADQPTGAVVVASSDTAVAGADRTLSDILVDGGSTITVSQAATSTLAAADETGSTITQGNVTIVGGATTTAVIVNQTASNAVVLADTAEGADKTATFTFKAMALNDTLTIDGLTFTAAKALTAAEAAAAYANISAGDTQGVAPVTNGVYSGTADADWASGDANGATVVFSAVSDAAAIDQSDLSLTASNMAAAVAVAGVAVVDAETGELGVINGLVDIDDDATASIKTISVDGYGGASGLGSVGSLDALTTLSLANSGALDGLTAGAVDATMDVTSTSTTVALNLDNVNGDVSFTAVENLNITTSGDDSAFILDAATLTALTVAGTADLDLTGSDETMLDALETVVVAGAAGLTLDASTASVTSVNASATSGDNTITVDSALASYTGGTGSDDVSVAVEAGTFTSVAKAISLGAGDDSFTMMVGTTLGAGTVSGGADTDTLVMDATNADTASGSTAFAAKVTLFERLTLTDAAFGDTVDLDVLGGFNYVTLAGSTDVGAQADVVTLDNLATGGTVVITADMADADATDELVVNITDADTTVVTLNLVVSDITTVDAGIVNAADVEVVNITSTDTNSTIDAVHTLTIKGAAITTATAAGNADLTLTLDANVVALSSLNASTMTGDLVASTNGTVIQTITGGAGDDILTSASALQDVLIGGAGDDILVMGTGRTTLTGGDGADTFRMGAASVNVNSAATITDASTGDILDLLTATVFSSAATDLDPDGNPDLQNFADAAILALGADEAGWFQYNSNTYVVVDSGADTSTFTDGQDHIVKISGLVDLSTASFSDDNFTLQFA